MRTRVQIPAPTLGASQTPGTLASWDMTLLTSNTLIKKLEIPFRSLGCKTTSNKSYNKLPNEVKT